MSPEHLREACALLWGPHWRVPASVALSVSDRTFRRWEAGALPIPEGVAVALADLLLAKSVAASALAAAIRGGASHG